ncbi:hypothetical protein GCM10010269_54680 [Streptomyces humidus]|uniref:DUF8175 domain-containing protein n=1 Tax=Streptomyces humidus TaxID=52259 RepID=A0A918FZP6_9ACTN|nr:hypothetical protein [Streptomyces humidus]GGS08561.1 hypothetical protein GCM10010269_54680 [Streptomyces humidus]
MTPGDEHDYGPPARTEEGRGYGGTRLRLPENDPYGDTRRGGRSSSRSLVTVVGVVVLLIAAIAFANRGGGDSGSTSTGGGKAAEPTATSTKATGTKPVQTKTGGIPSGFAHTQQGAESAAANFAAALGSTGMFHKDSRHDLVDTVYTAATAAKLKTAMDGAYSADFLAKMGLDADGNAPAGNTFVSRVVPIGTTAQSYRDSTAKVAVWYLGLIGMSGTTSTDPVTSSWKTWTFDLRWTGGDWKIVRDTQQDGPAPVPGDDPAATSDVISKAIQEYGGFTYAR